MSGLLEVHDAAVAFGGLQALGGASVRVDEGAIVGLIGPNGAGKTTLFNGISGLQRLDSGRIVFAGRDITSLAPYERAARGIGRSFQHLGLMLDETVETNVLAAQHLAAGYHAADTVLRPWRRRRREAALQSGASAALDRFNLGDLRERVVRDLSFAGARFVELACVVAGAPRLVLLDEPTTGLDVAEIVLLRDALARLRDEGCSILVIAHDVGFVLGLCDHVFVLAQGAVLAQGTPAKVRRNPAVIEAYLGSAA